MNIFCVLGLMVITIKSHSYTLCMQHHLEMSKYVHKDSAKYGNYKYEKYNPIGLK
jgi:hypothetical protein